LTRQKTSGFLFTLFFSLFSLVTASAGEPAPRVVRLATTTSTENSGLLRTLLPAFERASGYRVHVIAVGTGKALRMGRDGDVDVVLVHARNAERSFVREGYGEHRFSVMYNDFVLVGPRNDPAGVENAHTTGEAFRDLALGKALFVSRGDDSGTNKKELALWRSAGVKPASPWYREAGQGMGKVLLMSGELGAYTLTDRGTWLAFRDKLPLKIVFEGDPQLFNPYGIIAVNPKRHPHVNHEGAMALIRWITGDEGQRRIAAFTKGGEQLFTPSAIPSEVAVLQQ
jgi:ABC-type tungstate transport system, permease component